MAAVRGGGLPGGPDGEDLAAEAEARIVDGHYDRIVASHLHWGSRTMSSGLSALTSLPLVVLHFSSAQLMTLRRRVDTLQEHLAYLRFDFGRLGGKPPSSPAFLLSFWFCCCTKSAD